MTVCDRKDIYKDVDVKLPGIYNMSGVFWKFVNHQLMEEQLLVYDREILPVLLH